MSYITRKMRIFWKEHRRASTSKSRRKWRCR